MPKYVFCGIIIKYEKYSLFSFYATERKESDDFIARYTMKRFKKSNKSKFRAISLGAAAIATSLLIGLSACATTDDDEEEDENATTRQDTQVLQNGNFEFYDDNDGLYPISTPDNWEENNSSSSSMSGVINTRKDRWEYITDTTLPTTLEDNDDLEDDDEDKVDYNGALTDDLPYKNMHTATTSDASDDDKTYIDNPYTHKYSYNSDGKVIDSETGNEVTTYTDDDSNYYLDEALSVPFETSVLMIHNYADSDDYNGTAGYYSSSTTLTLEANTAAELSVWVKTSDMYYSANGNDRLLVNGERGAYIQVAQTVGGNSLDDFVIRNIDTTKLNTTGDNNGWVQYTIYIEANTYSETTITLTLGLGESSNRKVEGYAFFDDITYTKYKNVETMTAAVDKVNDDGFFDNTFYENGNAKSNVSVPLDEDNGKTGFRTDVENVNTNDTSNGNALTTITYNHNFSDRYFLIDLTKSTSKSETDITFSSSNVKAGLTVDDDDYVCAKTYDTNNTISVNREGVDTYNTSESGYYLPTKLRSKNGGTGVNISYDKLATLTGIKDTDNWSDGTSCDIFGDYKKTLAGALRTAGSLPQADTDNGTSAFVIFSAEGAAYEAVISDSTNFTLVEDEYKVVSFWLKTSDLNGNTAATITVRDKNDTDNSSNFTLDTTTVDGVEIDDEEDIYDGWVQCFIRVYLPDDDDDSTTKRGQFEIVVNYGNTTIKGTTASSYKAGWLAIANMSVLEVTEDVYGYTESASYAATISFDEETDLSSYYFDTEEGDKNDIKETIATPASYNGRNGQGANSTATSRDYDNDYAGLISKEYIETYYTTANTSSDYWYNKITALSGVTDANTAWSTIAGEAEQPLLIVNATRTINKGTSDEKTGVYNYGYVATSSSSVDADSYTAVSVKVKVSEGAIANVYLIDTDTENVATYSSTPKYTFWYDDDGNVLKAEPADNPTLAQKKANIAYTLRDDGLYENDGKYYANLYNLEPFYDSYDTEYLEFFDENGNKCTYDNIEDGVLYYTSADKTAYIPHYLCSSDGTKLYKYTGSGVGTAAQYYYIEDGEANTKKTVTTFDTSYAAVRYDSSETSANTNYQFTIDTTKDTNLADKWITVTFYVHTGSEAKSYTLELWSGERDKAQTEGVVEGSYVVFDYSSISVDETSYSDIITHYTDAIIADLKENSTDDASFESVDGIISDYEGQQKSGYTNIYNYIARYYTYTLYDSSSFVPFNEDTADDDQTGYSYTYSNYSETLAFLKIEDLLQSSNMTMSMFIDYSASDQDIEISTTSDDEEEEDEEESESSTNVWLLAASIALVAAIFVAIAAVVIKDLIKKARRKKTSGKNSYNFNKNKRYVKKYVKANGEAPALNETADDATDGDSTPTAPTDGTDGTPTDGE